MRSRRGTRVWLCRSEGAGRLRGMWTVRVFTEPRSDFKKSKDGERRTWGRLGHGDQGGGFWGGWRAEDGPVSQAQRRCSEVMAVRKSCDLNGSSSRYLHSSDAAGVGRASLTRISRSTDRSSSYRRRTSCR